ncbi:hypothetical protein [Lignipirellula cremea]|uniref:Uncharacterized protein n=1 Tax=Lignipirellula cremea TaxID=2528010 RepID=A0A518DNZ8_9BACT|nr:hypothetical protein [Lignipirellula cremea]QDU93561.1 hypothetical protein Pla8534_13410 [Lignipirellula cremea]
MRKRGLLWFSSLLVLAGCIGLAVYGGAIAGVLEVLTWRLMQPPAPPDPIPPALADIVWVSLSMIAVVAGMVVSAIAVTLRSRECAISGVGLLLYVIACVVLHVAAFVGIEAVYTARGTFAFMALSTEPPRVEFVEAAVLASRGGLATAGMILVVAPVLMLLAAALGFRALPDLPSARRSLFIYLGPVLIGTVLCVLAGSLGMNARDLQAMLEGAEFAPNPATLADRMAAIFNSAFLLWGGLAGLGILQVLAGLLAYALDSRRETPVPPSEEKD